MCDIEVGEVAKVCGGAVLGKGELEGIRSTSQSHVLEWEGEEGLPLRAE